MQRCDITIGGRYTAKISGRIVTVRVTAIRETPPWGRSDRWGIAFDCLNLSTGRRVTFRSPQRFRAAV